MSCICTQLAAELTGTFDGGGDVEFSAGQIARYPFNLLVVSPADGSDNNVNYTFPTGADITTKLGWLEKDFENYSGWLIRVLNKSATNTATLLPNTGIDVDSATPVIQPQTFRDYIIDWWGDDSFSVIDAGSGNV